MVRPMVDNFNQYRFINCGTTMATGDKQEPISTKKLALKDHLPNETKNTILKSPGNSPLPKDTTKLSSLKRQHPGSPSSPSRAQPLGTNGTNGHLVYVRRKLDTDPRKMNHNSVVSPLKKSSSDCKAEPNLQSETAQKAEISLPPSTTLEVPSRGSTASHSISNPVHEMPVPSPNCFRVTTVNTDAVPVKPIDELPVLPSNCSRGTTAIPDAVPVKLIDELPVPSPNCSRVTTAIPDVVAAKPIDELPVPSSNCSRGSMAIPDAVPVKPINELPVPSSNCSRVTMAFPDVVPAKPIKELPVPLSNCSRVPMAIPDAVPVKPVNELHVPSSNGSRVTTAIPDSVPGKHIDELPVSSSNGSRVTTGIPNAVAAQPEPHKPRDYWKERFGRLQIFLKSCDESGQEEYIQRLRSLSAAGRSRHAVELEKRAIQLTLEEGNELKRMTALNVFGKLPDQNGAVTTRTHSSPKVVQDEQQ